jgi:hypothetical protein
MSSTATAERPRASVEHENRTAAAPLEELRGGSALLLVVAGVQCVWLGALAYVGYVLLT